MVQVKLNSIASILINNILYSYKTTELKNSSKIVGVISNFDLRLKDMDLLNDMELKSFDFILWLHTKQDYIDLAIYETKKINTNEVIFPHECHIGNEFVKDYQGARNVGWKSI